MSDFEEPHISVVIRAYNEAEQLNELLCSIKSQSYPQNKIQIIVVDNGSTDTTSEVAEMHGAEIVKLDQKQFTYPKSLNLGFAQANNEIVFSFSGHCLLKGNQYFSTVVRHFKDSKNAGVSGSTLPRKPCTISEILITYPFYWRHLLKGVRIEKAAKSGTLQNVNSAIRKSLWLQHQFNENWAAGGEDVEWATWAISNGKTLLFDPHMTVYHSHHLGIIGLYKQFKHWNTLLVPRKFVPEELDFRKDIHRS